MTRVLTPLRPPYLADRAVVGSQRGIEQPLHEVLVSVSGDDEIRQYGERIDIETAITSVDPGNVRNTALHLLFACMLGANESNTKIVMTVPVEIYTARLGHMTTWH